jgi:membrane protease YdiL (CAAX protease family)
MVRLLWGTAVMLQLPAPVRQSVFFLNCFNIAWMLGYPLWIVRRKRVHLSRASLRRVVIEAVIAVPTLLVIWLVLAVVLAAWTLLAPEVLPTNPLDSAAQAGAWTYIALFTLLASLVAPLTEEVFFRGMLYKGLRHRIHPVAAAVLQAAAFGLLHNVGYSYAALATLLGLALAVVYELRQTILAPMFVHSFHNLSVGLLALIVAIGAANAPVLGIAGNAHDGGCLLTDVTKGSGAEDAGLQVNDVITSVNGLPVSNAPAIAAIVRQKQAGDKIRLEFIRAGEVHRVEAVLKSR